MLSTAILYAIAYFLCWSAFGIKIVESRVPYDFALNLALALLVFAISRRIWPFLLLQALYFGVFYGASALKIAPEEPSVLSNLGLSYVLAKDLPKAEEIMRRANSRARLVLRINSGSRRRSSHR